MAKTVRHALRSLSAAISVLLLMFIPNLTNAQGIQPTGATTSSPNTVDPPELTLEADETRLPKEPFGGRLRSLVRSVGATATILPGGGDDGLGITDVALRASIMVPTTLESVPVVILSPSFGFRFLDAPDALGLPSELYSASLSATVMYQWSDRTTLVGGITGGVYSDFEATDNAFRLTGHGAANINMNNRWALLLGVAVLNRSDIPVLPMAGFVYKPDPDTRIELTAPRPRIAHRVHWFDSFGEAGDDWAYLAGEFGGGTFAVRRLTGADDELNLRDFRLIAGFERKQAAALSTRAEIGYVFGRNVEFEDDPTEFEPSDTLMFRIGLSY